MENQEITFTLVELTGDIVVENAEEQAALRRLQENITRSILQDSESTVKDRLFQSERVDRIDGNVLAEKPIFTELNSLAQEIAEQGPDPDGVQYRVFRRNTPTISAQLPGSVPEWGAGAKVAFTEGPFQAVNGFTYWFDFYQITRTVAIHIGGEATPSVLVPVQIFVFGSSQTQYNIQGDSIWIRSNLFTSNAPVGHYTGLSITGGTLSLSAPGSLNDERLDLAANVSIGLELELLQQDGPIPEDSNFGADAREAGIQLPESVSFSISLNNLSVESLGRGRWNLYNQPRRFSFIENGTISYSEPLKRILIPCEPTPDDLAISNTNVQSPLIDLDGEGSSTQAAWALPTAAINTNTPPTAAGIGGFANQVQSDYEISWPGLEGGPIRLNNTWVVLEPGMILIISDQASNIVARQQFDLWLNEESSYPSQARVQFTDAFTFIYFATSSGEEAFLTQADTDIIADRPVKVDCQPFSIKGADTFFLYTASEADSRIFLYDQNILVDAALDEAGNIEDPEILKPVAIALNNTLLTVTNPISFMLTGRLANPTTVRMGNLVLLHGLYYLLPTLPDPYAANLASFLRDQQSTKRDRQTSRSNFRQAVAYLLCTVSWPPASNANELNASVSYQFLPLNTNSQGQLGFAKTNRRPTTTTATPTSDNPNTIGTTDNPNVLFASNYDVYNPDEHEEPWDGIRSIFGEDCFSLLDVSTNADLMGISYGGFDKRLVFEVTHQPLDPNGEADFDRIPYTIEGMDLKASGQFVKSFTVPQISWEPVVNLSDIQERPADPPMGFLGFKDDGGPTKIFNTSARTVTLAPIPMTNFLLEQFENNNEAATYTLFTLPFGMEAMASINRRNHFTQGPNGSQFELNQPNFEKNLKGGIQLKTTGAFNPVEENLNFEGNTLQRTNLISSASPAQTSVLGESVTSIFNTEFSTQTQFFKQRGVPLERIDFSGYGASIFSNWLNKNATFAETSQAKFDVLVGRTAHEIIQVRSVIYPWGIYVVRTITLFRVGSGYVYRVDSGWRAESDGAFDFNISVEDFNATFTNNYDNFFAGFTGVEEIKNLRPYSFYPGVIKRISNVKNITETTDFPNFNYNRNINNGEVFKTGDGRIVPYPNPGIYQTAWDVTLTPVRFTADVEIDGIKEGGVDGRVPSKEIIGYIQLSPAGTPIPRDAMIQLLEERPEIGGAIDCVVDIGDSGQLMRLNRIEVTNALNPSSAPIFVGAAKGTPILPQDGSWSLALHNAQTDKVTPVTNENGIPLIRGGEWLRDANGNWSANQVNEDYRLADPADLLNFNPGDVFNYAFLQNTSTQKVLYSLPSFAQGERVLKTATQHFADAYHLLNSKGVFPDLQDIETQLDLQAENIAISIIEEGYKLVDDTTANLVEPVKKALDKVLPKGPWYWVGSENGDEPVKIYLEYATPEVPDSVLNFDLDSEAKKWVSAMNDTSIVIDLGPFERLFLVKGSFNSEKGAPFSINQPILEVGPDLKPIYDVLVLLVELSQALDTGSYGDLLEKGLEVAMSNNPEVWDYKFSAKKEIPLLRFPPPALDSPTSPLRLEASMALGAYFNMDLPTSTDLDQLIPSAGAFIEFYAQLSVMCVSIAAATVYAVGKSEVRIYGDIKDGPGITMRHGFGVELSVGLPVIGSVSLLYQVGIDMDLNTNAISVGAFLLFKGRAEILGGIVTVTIFIEAQGSIERQLPSGVGGETTMEAQVTFGLDISIFWVIDISFEESWKETRKIG